jgi:hypothetical protein
MEITANTVDFLDATKRKHKQEQEAAALTA